MFNILTRTNSRPKYFFLCSNSIKEQNYEGTINHYVSVDDPKTMEYLELYRNTLKTINVERKQKTQPNSFPYNNYLNEMLSKIEDGWIMILDDDDKFIKNDALRIIMEKIKNCDDEDILILWKVKIGSRICPSSGFFGKSIRRGDISNIGFAFHSKHKDKAFWPDVRGGDFKCIETLSKKLKVIWIDDILTCTNSNAGNFGNQRDITLNTDDTKKYVEFCNKYSEFMGKMRIEPYLNDIQEEVNDTERPESLERPERPERPESTESLESTFSSIESLQLSKEKIYILKESTIVTIAEMLSNAIKSKQLYEDIIKQNYLADNSIKYTTKNIEPVSLHKPTTNAKEILKQLEKEDQIRATAMMKKSEIYQLPYEDDIDCFIILTRNMALKERTLEYFKRCNISKNILQVSTESNNFNSIGIINAAKLALEKNYKRIMVVHENSLVIKTFTKEMQVLCSYEKYKNSDIILCGIQETIGRSNSSNKISVRSRAKKKVNTTSLINIELDTDYYCSIYEDLRENDITSHNKAKEHWNNYGFDEGRFGKRQLIPIDKSMSINDFNGVILSKNACINISECFDESLVSIMLLKEFINNSYIALPYFFDTQEGLKTRKYNTSLYNN